MLDSHPRSTGTEYTMTAALVIVAVIFIPAAVILSRPVGFVSVLLAMAASVLSIVLAWIRWKKYSRLTIPSLLQPGPVSRPQRRVV